MDTDEQLEIMLDELREDLTDGQDLALAARLVGDALGRRVRRARETLRHLNRLADRGDGAFGLEPDELAQRLALLEDRTADFEDEMRALAERMTSMAEGYEQELRRLAERTDEDTD